MLWVCKGGRCWGRFVDGRDAALVPVDPDPPRRAGVAMRDFAAGGCSAARTRLLPPAGGSMDSPVGGLLGGRFARLSTGADMRLRGWLG
jgi:hypothetical protein